MIYALYASAGILIGGTLMSLLHHDYWWVRVFDFPRKQIATGILCVVGGLFAAGETEGTGAFLIAGLLLCFLYQFDHVIQYTQVAPREVTPATKPRAKTRSLALLTANVEMENRSAGPLLDLVKKEDPDVVLAIETDRWWARRLSALTERFSYTCMHPKGNRYGMCLLSKRPLLSAEIRHIVSEDTPSIKAEIDLGGGVSTLLYGIHPPPPHPIHEPDTTRRDAELIRLGEEIRERQMPAVVSGDLNDVSWSETTDLFEKVSGLLDPRRGRGFYNTFHARYPIIRYPLDHTFHSRRFRLKQISVKGYIGSDHYPVLTELQYDPKAEEDHDPPVKSHIVEGWAEREMEKLRRKESSGPVGPENGSLARGTEKEGR
ncbi:endonuclease/exonuclease/phosphatase family protein [Salinibacter ruber]|jgi:endonuclease/exonuclease/phosphatase (EEP) superfamily protein YafD|uniref:endonuclease/exonuclease/phosphatase family protein n=1 Tax=Salinibacter ruber TaxID=146919 RepID=UPI002073587E|nr:endonuclease/exonuclease/phosphatase family protein [Salinibacter ruber]